MGREWRRSANRPAAATKLQPPAAPRTPALADIEGCCREIAIETLAVATAQSMQ